MPPLIPCMALDGLPHRSTYQPRQCIDVPRGLEIQNKLLALADGLTEKRLADGRDWRLDGVIGRQLVDS